MVVRGQELVWGVALAQCVCCAGPVFFTFYFIFKFIASTLSDYCQTISCMSSKVSGAKKAGPHKVTNEQHVSHNDNYLCSQNKT